MNPLLRWRHQWVNPFFIVAGVIVTIVVLLSALPLTTRPLSSPRSVTISPSLTLIEPRIHTPPTRVAAAAFMTIVNDGTEDEYLLAATADFAKTTSIHQATHQNGIARMRPVTDGIRIPAGQRLTLQSGGYHLMLLDLQADIQVGTEADIVLTFDRRGQVTVPFAVVNPYGSDSSHQH